MAQESSTDTEVEDGKPELRRRTLVDWPLWAHNRSVNANKDKRFLCVEILFSQSHHMQTPTNTKTNSQRNDSMWPILFCVCLNDTINGR